MPQIDAQLDARVRHVVYDGLAKSAVSPSVEEICRTLAADRGAVRASMQRLAEAHMLVLDGETVEMALPFSAIERPHRVLVGERRYFANCAWDCFGVLAALDVDGTVLSICPDCDDGIELRVEGDRVEGDAIAHFVVPARRWWADIRFT